MNFDSQEPPNWDDNDHRAVNPWQYCVKCGRISERLTDQSRKLCMFCIHEDDE